MAKKARSTDQARKRVSSSYDPALANLFESSLGPIDAASQKAARTPDKATVSLGNQTTVEPRKSDPHVGPTPDGQIQAIHRELDSENNDQVVREDKIQRSRKRKHKDAEDNIEGVYMQKLVREEIREDSKRRKQDHVPTSDSPSSAIKALAKTTTELGSEGGGTSDERESSPPDVPQHESLRAPKSDSDVEKASRTVFLANVSTVAIKSKSGKRALLEHLASYLPSLPNQQTPHKVESLRFRSTAFTNSAVPKKAAFAKKELMESTTKSTNAYAVYSTQLAAREATKRLNGTMVLDRHLRVDSVAHPAKQDHRRCVFVGNLGFVDDESSINAVEDDANNKRPRKKREAADVEEGLWRQFSKASTLESVRVVRDKTTRVGKGFAYVQFEDPNGVEKALLFNDKKFPPLLPRTLRVTRAKNAAKTHSRQRDEKRPKKNAVPSQTPSGYQPKIGSQVQSLSGRAGKLLGRAGAAQLQDRKKRDVSSLGVSKSPEAIVFEGYRASSKQGKGTIKLGGTGKKRGKPQDRSSKRGAAFKANGRKNGKT